MLSDSCLSCPVCLSVTLVYCVQTAPEKGHSSPAPLFDPCLLWWNGWMNQDATWYRGRPWPRLQCVRWGPTFPQKGHTLHKFSAHVWCGQTAGWIEIPLGMEVGLGPGDIVLDGDPARPPPHGKGHSSLSLFSPYLLWPNSRPSQQLLSSCLPLKTGRLPTAT